jgi:hypothetical protein
MVTGKANALWTEVDGPGFLSPLQRRMITAGYFGKAENMVSGNADKTAPVDRRIVVRQMICLLDLPSQQL